MRGNYHTSQTAPRSIGRFLSTFFHAEKRPRTFRPRVPVACAVPCHRMTSPSASCSKRNGRCENAAPAPSAGGHWPPARTLGNQVPGISCPFAVRKNKISKRFPKGFQGRTVFIISKTVAAINKSPLIPNTMQTGWAPCWSAVPVFRRPHFAPGSPVFPGSGGATRPSRLTFHSSTPTSPVAPVSPCFPACMQSSQLAQS